MKRLAIQGSHFIPHSVQDAMCYAASHQWQAFVKQYGTIAAFEQLRRLGSKTSVGLLVDLLAPGIITTQGYVRLAFALKLGSRLSHTVLERMTSAKHVEGVQERARALADIQLDTDWGDAFQEITVHQSRNTAVMERVIDRWQLHVITRKYHKVVRQRDLAHNIQEGIFHHEKFIKYQRALEKPFWIRCFSLL